MLVQTKCCSKIWYVLFEILRDDTYATRKSHSEYASGFLAGVSNHAENLKFVPVLFFNSHWEWRVLFPWSYKIELDLYLILNPNTCKMLRVFYCTSIFASNSSNGHSAKHQSVGAHPKAYICDIDAAALMMEYVSV